VTEDGVTPERLDRRRLLQFLGGWAAVVLLPGIATINQPVILAYVVWGLGFLASLVLFTLAAQMTRTTELWPWLVASILPWVINLSVAEHPIYIPVFVVAVGLLAAWIYLRSSATDQLLHEGVEGTGTVIEVIEPKAITAVVNNGYLRRSIRLTVERPDKTKTYEAVLRDLFKADELPSPGDKIQLRIDPEDATRVMAAPVKKPAKPSEESAKESSEEDETASDA
jgi:hypothetical protein